MGNLTPAQSCSKGCKASGASCQAAISDAKVRLNAQDLPLPNSLNHRLLCASRDGDLANVTEAIIRGAFLETRRPFRMVAESGADGLPPHEYGPLPGMTPLMYACKGGYPAVVTTLIDAKACVNAADEDGMRPLHFAAAGGELDVAAMLIRVGADVNAQDADGNGPLDHLPPDAAQDASSVKQWQNMIRAAEQNNDL